MLGRALKALTINRGQSPFRTLDDQATGFMTGFGVSGSMPEKEAAGGDYLSMVSAVYKASGPVFAAIAARGYPFSEARFQFQELRSGRPGRLFGTPDLSLLEHPWPNATTGELLWRMEQDASLAGNSFLTPVGVSGKRRIRRLRPDWVTIISGVAGEVESSAWDIDAEVLAYVYSPKGLNAPEAVLLTPDQVAHYSPIPDPDAQWRGMSWLTPLLAEISADQEATAHKAAYFRNGTTSNMVVSYDASRTIEQVKAFRDLFDQSHRGARNAYKALHMGGGADIKSLGADMQQIDFKALQGASETRIAAAAGVGSIIARFSEGMQGSSLNQGNYNAAKRQFADMTLRPLWRTAAASLAKPAFVTVPTGARLWVDTRDIEFLKEDRLAATDIQAKMAATIRALVDSGFDPDAVIDAVEADDLSRLVGTHSGLFSVQLQPAGTQSQGGTTP
jgi:phage portal protein BeeE